MVAKYQKGQHFIKEWRKFRGLSLRELESRLECDVDGNSVLSFTTLQKIETGKSGFTEDSLNAIASALEIERTWLLNKKPVEEDEFQKLFGRLSKNDQETIVEFMKVLLKKAR